MIGAFRIRRNSGINDFSSINSNDTDDLPTISSFDDDGGGGGDSGGGSSGGGGGNASVNSLTDLVNIYAPPPSQNNSSIQSLTDLMNIYAPPTTTPGTTNESSLINGLTESQLRDLLMNRSDARSSNNVSDLNISALTDSQIQNLLMNGTGGAVNNSSINLSDLNESQIANLLLERDINEIPNLQQFTNNNLLDRTIPTSLQRPLIPLPGDDLGNNSSFIDQLIN